MAEGKRRWTGVFLVLVPAWLVVSAGFGIWWKIKQAERGEAEEQARYPSSVNSKELVDDVRKIALVVGKRGIGGAEAQRGLDRVAAMIEGSLGPSNTGYQVKRIAGPTVGGRTWPLIEVVRAGADRQLPGLWVICGYDAPVGSRGIEWNASGVASVLAVARELVDANPERSLHFLFLPHVFDEDAPVLETMAVALRRIEAGGGALQVLCVDGMGRSDRLAVATREIDSPVVTEIVGLGKVLGAEAQCLRDDGDLASMLFESGLRAARVTSAAGAFEEAPESLPDPKVLAGSAGRLVELLRRLAAR